jgi:hypothetical protein
MCIRRRTRILEPASWSRNARYRGNSVRALREQGCHATGSFETLPLAEESHAELVGRPTDPTSDASQHRDKPIDRDHQDVPQAAGRRVREPGRPPAPHRADTTADAGEKAMPLVPEPERDGDRRTPSSWSRSRTPTGSARSPTSRCPLVPARAASAGLPTRPPEAARARAGPRPRSERQRRCARRATGRGGRRGRTRAQPRAECLLLTTLPRSRQSAPASRRLRSPSLRGSRQPAVLLATRVIQLTHSLGRRDAAIVAPASDGSATRHARLVCARCPSAGSFQIGRVPSSHAGSYERDLGGPIEHTVHQHLFHGT